MELEESPEINPHLSNQPKAIQWEEEDFSVNGKDEFQYFIAYERLN
jgi:hypothetical protein